MRKKIIPPRKIPATLKTAHIERKSYSYAYGNVSLTFNLRTDVRVERKEFLQLLKQAVTDLEKELKQK